MLNLINKETRQIPAWTAVPTARSGQSPFYRPPTPPGMGDSAGNFTVSCIPEPPPPLHFSTRDTHYTRYTLTALVRYVPAIIVEFLNSIECIASNNKYIYLSRVCMQISFLFWIIIFVDSIKIDVSRVNGILEAYFIKLKVFFGSINHGTMI